MSKTVRSQAEIAEEIADLLTAEEMARYAHLSYGEMAEIPELAEYADDLRAAERDWFAAE